MFSVRDGGESTFQRCNRVESGKTRVTRVTRAQADSDGMVHRVDLVTVCGGSRRHFKRPVTETILLPSETQ